MDKYQYPLVITNSQARKLHSIRDQTESNTVDVLRMFCNHCFQDRVLNEIYPTMSGRISVEAKQ